MKWMKFIASAALVSFILIGMQHFGVLGQTDDTNQTITYGERFDQVCAENVCTMSIYDYDVNFYNETEDSWVKINESFYECDVGYCTPEYNFQATIGFDTTVTTAIKDTKYSTRVIDINGEKLDFTSYLKDNEVVFPSIIPKTLELHYLYLSDQIKETYVFNSVPVIPKGQDTFNITYENIGDPILDQDVEILCDAKGNCQKILIEYNKTNTVIPVPVSMLQDPNLAYPLYLDPSQNFNGTPDTTFSGHVEFSSATSTYTRFADPTLIRVGKNSTMGSIFFLVDRASVEFDISSLPQNIDISEVTLRLFVLDLGNNLNNRINFTNMEGRNSTYPNDNDGNQLFSADMGNGTSYNVTTLDEGSNRINLTSAGIDILNSITNGWFGIGMWSPIPESVSVNVSGMQTLGFRSRVFGSVNNRPLLNVTYSFIPGPKFNTTIIIRQIPQDIVIPLYMQEAFLVVLILLGTGFLVWNKTRGE